LLLKRTSVQTEAHGLGLRKLAQVTGQVLNVSPKTNWFFVPVRDDRGQTAWGEASINGREPVLGVARRLGVTWPRLFASVRHWRSDSVIGFRYQWQRAF
jgi:hypothetical protein